MALTLKPVTSGYSTGVINQNFQRLEEALNDEYLRRDGVQPGSPNAMQGPLDMNGYPLLNVSLDGGGGGSNLLTLDEADSRYANLSGDTMVGPLFVREPIGPTEAAQIQQIRDEADDREASIAQATSGYQAGDASLQDQISGLADIPATERPIIQWHSRVINNSITIPDNVNAFTTGPFIAIAQGQEVTVGEDSFWTIVNGVDSDSVVTSPLNNFDEGTL